MHEKKFYREMTMADLREFEEADYVQVVFLESARFYTLRRDNPVFEQAGIGTPTMYVGTPDENLVVEPDQWNEEGFEYAMRLSLMIRGSILTVNGFYGRENSPQLLLPGFVEQLGVALEFSSHKIFQTCH